MAAHVQGLNATTSSAATERVRLCASRSGQNSSALRCCNTRNPRRCGVTMAIDGRETWNMQNYSSPGETGLSHLDRDWVIRSILGVRPDFEYEVLSHEDWIARRLVASKFRDRRVFICGDAAHVWMPLGGFGMSAGIADAANLAWKLAGVLHGWAAPEILDAYEAERQPITDQASRI